MAVDHHEAMSEADDGTMDQCSVEGVTIDEGHRAETRSGIDNVRKVLAIIEADLEVESGMSSRGARGEAEAGAEVEKGQCGLGSKEK